MTKYSNYMGSQNRNHNKSNIETDHIPYKKLKGSYLKT